MADTELVVPQAAKEAAEPDADKEVKVVLMRHVGGEFASWQRTAWRRLLRMVAQV